MEPKGMGRQRIDMSGCRYQVEPDGSSYRIRDTLSGLLIGTSSSETTARHRAIELNGPSVHRPQTRPKPYGPPRSTAQQLKLARKAEPHGKCWSKLGMVNSDSASPVHGSIRNLGLKIKLRDVTKT